ncbi:MAG: ABC transporter permease [Spirochaetales bacterium]
MRLARIAFRNLGRNTTRTILSVGAITLASILGVFFLALIEGMQVEGRENALRYQTGVIQVRHAEFGEYEYRSPMHLYVRNAAPLEAEISEIEGVTSVNRRVSAPGQIYIDSDQTDSVPGERHSAVAFGIELDKEEALLEPDELVVAGRLPAAGTREVGVGVELAEKIGLGVGDSFSFITETAERSVNAISLEISGILDFPQASYNATQFLASFDVMQQFLRMQTGAQQLVIMTDDPEDSENELAAVREIVATSGRDDLAVSYWKEESFVYAMLSSTEIFYDIFVLIFLALGATVIVNTTMMTVFERYREIGLLGAMGMKPAEIVRLFFLEALIAGCIAAVLGVSIGSVISLVFGEVGLRLPEVYSDLGFEMSNVFYPVLTWQTVVLMFFYTVGIPSLVTLLPTRRAARIEPVDAINAT